MYVSIGQGGNQLAACFWQRAHQHRQAHTERAVSSKGAAAATSARTDLPPPVSPLFAMDGYAHAILLDAEPKVVGKLAQLGEEIHTTAAAGAKAPATPGKSKASKHPHGASTGAPPPIAPASSLFRPRNLFFEQYGRGNNWAMGYFGRLGNEGADGTLLSDTLEAIRREAERMEVCDSIVTMHSIAGGTGSGLGSRVTEEIREHYPKQFLLACAIAPFGNGDTPLQHYNSLLCLSHLYPAVDGLVLASNADMARALQSHAMKAAADTSGGGSPAMSFAGINTYLSACLADILAPTRLAPTFREMDQAERHRMQLTAEAEVNVTAAPASSSSRLLASQPLHELISSVCPLPAYKLMEIWSSAGLGASTSAGHMDPRAQWQPSWKACADALKRCVPRSDDQQATATAGEDGDARVSDLASSSSGSSSASLGYAVYARGDSSVDPVSACSADLTLRFAKLFPCVSWNPHPQDLITTVLPRMAWRNPLPLTSLEKLRQDRPTAPAESTRSLAVAVNRVRTAQSLAPAVRKARVLLDHKAYLHWYTRYGLEESELSDAIRTIDDIIRDYERCDAK